MGQTRQPRFGGGLSGWAQVAFDHRHAFAVGGDDQHSTGFGGWRDTPAALLFVESVEVLRHTTRDLFRLPFGDFRASVTVERLENFVERLFRRVLCDHSLDRMRMECGWQIERRIKRVQTIKPAPAKAGARKPDPAEDGFDLARV